jgi:hypothetical protein
MSDIFSDIEKAFNDPNEQSKLLKNVREGEYANPDVQQVAQWIPSLAKEEPDFSKLTRKEDFPEYKNESRNDSGDDEKESKPKANKLNQKERLKQKIMQAEQEKAMQAKQIDELTLRNAYLENQSMLLEMQKLEKEKADQARIAAEELYLKEKYRNEDNYQASIEADYKSKQAIIQEDKIKDELARLKNQYQSHSTLVNSAYEEFRRKDYNYKPQYEYEEDEGKNKAVDRFLNSHKFLDNRFENPNYSPRLAQIAQNLEATLADKYKIEGRGTDIYTDDFFQDLSSNLKVHLKNEFNTQLPANQQQQPYGDGMNMQRFSQDFSAPVTRSEPNRLRYKAPMNQDDKIARQNWLQTIKDSGLTNNISEVAESYDEIFNTYKQSY